MISNQEHEWGAAAVTQRVNSPLVTSPASPTGTQVPEQSHCLCFPPSPMLTHPGKSRWWPKGPCHSMGDPGGIHGFWLQPCPGQATVSIWGNGWQIKALTFSFSLYLSFFCLSVSLCYYAFQINTSPIHSFIAQMTATAGADPAQNQKPETPSRFAAWVAGN